ncbi:MAG: hypothetical protein L6V93_10670 [Clostridiales bacterium]|nr:MAG: hypothetical protein L6V93_10670 [Clostridiales bacterium]
MSLSKLKSLISGARNLSVPSFVSSADDAVRLITTFSLGVSPVTEIVPLCVM